MPMKASQSSTEVMNLHAPVRKQTVKACSAPWIDEELKAFLERDEGKDESSRSKLESDQQIYRQLRNYALK